MIEIDTDKNRLDFETIHRYLSKESYWAKGRDMETVRRSLENSVCFGAYLNDVQIGFARVVTDRAVFAWIMDVFILPEHRGKGYSKELMRAILAFPELRNLSRWGLATEDAHRLYAQFGFTALSKPGNIMELLPGKSI